ncbi:phosphonate ABC transporter, periplasmic phosphonate-binding protein [Magnetococcus marinus MC-1]|uniref:Phosphonate ABC transporter, periplasmic phosphonate-binding protein n=1 Tax=Magnetococcus marinus (strain ATCC BAA-1437 / JCM 17883 / MC-1) TaxID=156889 RepID=A0LDH7_MAGMM|nr:phosphate/phosphite/phosphonate ABC transporter substrate-binding protein [Magnetococcus marinus]ABK46020.1 phosphonate ABC transporter, periplasmic phosphonate-binding protein [Magnetococcus marinus MC-1]
MLRNMLIILLMLAVWTPVARAQEGLSPLLLAIHPYLSRDELLHRFTPLADYLAEHLHRPVAVRIGTSYQDHLYHIAHDKVDLALLGPAAYVDMFQQYGKKPLLTRFAIKGIPYFHGYIVVRKDSPIKQLEDLKGHLFAFGDPKSTMSHLVPRSMLREKGITVSALSGYAFLGSHQNVALAVLAGDFDAGAIKEEVYQTFKTRGLRVLATTPAFSEHLFVARSTLDEVLVQQVRQIMLDMYQSPQGRAVLTGIKANLTALVPVHNEDYDALTQLINNLAEAGIR